jgi:hypothetical protein
MDGPMQVRVAPEFVSPFCDLPKQVRIGFRHPSKTEEGGLDLGLIEEIQKVVRVDLDARFQRRPRGDVCH